MPHLWIGLERKDNGKHAVRSVVAKGLYTQFLDDDEFFCEMTFLQEQCEAALVRAMSSEFENWIVRIGMGARNMLS